MTNYEKIKNMSIEEMADLINYATLCDLKNCEECGFGNLQNCNSDTIKNWLKKKVIK